MNDVAIYLACAAGALWPLVPGLLELRSPGAQPMRVDQQYARDPRYLGKAWRSTVDPLLMKARAGERVPFMKRKDEFASLVGDERLPDNMHVTDVVLARGSFQAGAGTTLLDVFAAGMVDLGADCKIRCLAADDNVKLGARTTVTRWVDVEGNLHASPSCDLGSSASATGTLIVDGGSRFRRLFAAPIVAGTGNGSATPLSNWRRHRSDSVKTIASGQRVDGDVIADGDVMLGAGTIVNGSIKAGGGVLVGAAARVQGNVIARGDVAVGQRAAISGHIFSDCTITIATGAAVGRPDDMKTVQAVETLQLAPGATVYGWAICERGGSVAAIGA
jgi:cytoskeletal protein CcmA (bactofilin family)